MFSLIVLLIYANIFELLKSTLMCHTKKHKISVHLNIVI